MANFKTIEVAGWSAAIKGMRNPMKSWDRSDSNNWDDIGFILSENDYKLAKSLCKAGSEHRKWMRMVVVWADITAPRYW